MVFLVEMPTTIYITTRALGAYGAYGGPVLSLLEPVSDFALLGQAKDFRVSGQFCCRRVTL